MSTNILISLFGHKAWANPELFALLGTLPGEHAEQLHSCIRTLNHMVVDGMDVVRRLRAQASPEQFLKETIAVLRVRRI